VLELLSAMFSILTDEQFCLVSIVFLSSRGSDWEMKRTCTVSWTGLCFVCLFDHVFSSLIASV